MCVLGEGREGDGQQETVLYRYQHSVTCDVRPAASRLDDAMKETVRSPCTVLMKQRIDAHEDTLKKTDAETIRTVHETDWKGRGDGRVGG